MLVILPLSFQPNLLVNPYYEPKELQAEDREKLFGRDEAHLRRMLGSISIAPTAHAVTALPTNATACTAQPPSAGADAAIGLGGSSVGAGAGGDISTGTGTPTPQVP